MKEVFEELRNALYSIWYRRWLALGVAWGLCLLGWLAVALIPNSFEAKARIYVALDDVLSEQIGIAGDGKQEIMRVRQTLASAVNLEKVVRSTRLGEGLRSRAEIDEAIADLAKKVTVKSEEDNLFEVTARVGKSSLSDAENAVLARDVVQKLVDIFREENIAGNRNEVAGTMVFLDQQLEQRKRELEAAEQRRLAFEIKHPELIGGAATFGTKIQQARTELRGIEGDLAAAQSALAAIESQLASTPRTIVTATGESGARGALMQAQAQLAQLRGRGLTEEHPDIVAVKKQIALLRQQVRERGASADIGEPNPAYSALLAIRAERQANVEALQVRRAALQSDLAALVASQANEPEIAAEANRISRDYEVLRKKYEELLQDREEIRLRGQVEAKRSSFKFELVDPPVVPRKPAAPNRPLLIFGVLFAGVLGGMGTAYAIGQVRSTFSTADALERALRIPVIGSVSYIVKASARELERKRLKQFVAASAGLFAIFAILQGIEFLSISRIA